MGCKDRRDLAAQALSALKWNYGGTLVRSGAQILIGIVLARILGPEPFGLVAIAWIVISLGNLVADFGFGAAIVQRSELSHNEVRYAFTYQVLIGFSLTLLVALAANLIAQIFKQQSIVPIVQVLSLIFLFQALGQTATSLLKRNLNFKSLQFVQVASYLVSYLLLGIPLAFTGFGVWSVVSAQLSQSLLQSLIAYALVRHPIKPLFKCSAIGFFSFGTKVIATNLINWLIGNLDNVFVGKFFGAISLGLYSRTYLLITAPMNNIVIMLQGVLFSTCSKIQASTDKLKQVYLASASILALIFLPVFVCLALIPRTAIAAIYGNRWLDAVPLLVPLALAMPFHAVMALSGPLIWGQGKVERELRVQALTATLFIAVMLATSLISVEALAWGVFGVYVIRFVLMTREVLQVVRASWRELLVALRGSLLVAIGAALVISEIDAMLLSYSIPSSIHLLLDFVAAAVVTIGLFLALPKVVLSPEAIWVISYVLNQRLPHFRWLLKHVNQV